MLFPIFPQASVPSGVHRSHSRHTCGLTKGIWKTGEIWEVENLTQRPVGEIFPVEECPLTWPGAEPRAGTP